MQLERHRSFSRPIGIIIMIFSDDVDQIVRAVNGHRFLVCHLPCVRHFVVVARRDDLLPRVVGKYGVVARLKRDVIPRAVNERPAFEDVVHRAAHHTLATLHGVGRAIYERLVRGEVGDDHVATVVDEGVRGKSESGAGAVGAGAVVCVDSSIGVQVAGVVSAIPERGAGPLNNGGAVHVGNLERAGDFQRRALHIKPAFRFVQLSGRQRENSTFQCANDVVAVAGGVLEFRGADGPTDVCIK